MPRRNTRYLLLVVALALLGGAAASSRLELASPPAVPEAAAPSTATATVDTPAPRPVITAAAEAVRLGDWESARRALAAAAPPGAELLLGLYAHALERPDEAIARLAPAIEDDDKLQDWALWALADALAARHRTGESLAVLERLIGEHPDSPLAPRAAVRAAELARAGGELGRLFSIVDRGRAIGAAGDLALQLESLDWEAAGEAGAVERRREAARRLLSRHPRSPVEAGARALLAGGQEPPPPWRDLLPPADLLRRADGLLALGDPAAAYAVLAEVPADHRSFAWHLRTARALIAYDRGDAALALLDGARPSGPAEAAQLAWEGADAWREQARVLRGRDNLPLERRQEARRQALRELLTAARLAPDADSARRSLRAMLTVLENQEASFETRLPVLRELLRLDPPDDLAARLLWERGWEQYQAGNSSGAVGYWSELWDLAPRHRYGRGARYWTARAFERLGERERAARLFHEVAATDTTDFYRRHALARLAGDPGDPRSGLPLAAEPWPDDPHLARARLLSDLGLDHLGATELALVRPHASARAAAALEGLILARQERPRESMGPLREAFPSLGTPSQGAVPALALELYYPLRHREAVERWATARELPRSLVMAVIRQESAFDTRATSHAGARGLMQLMPATAKELAGKLGIPYSPERLYDPEISLQVGTRYLQQVLAMFDGNVELALAGYNGGPYRIRRWWREAGPRRELDSFIEGLALEESRTYVKRILLLADSYRRLYHEG